MDWTAFADSGAFFGAVVAAIASVYAVVVTVRPQRDIAKLQAWSIEQTNRVNHYTAIAASIVPEQREVRMHMSRTRSLFERVVAAFGELVVLQLTRNGVKKKVVLDETTKALDLYAEYLQHLGSHELASYPDDLLSQLEVFQLELTELFLHLQINVGTVQPDNQAGQNLQRSFDCVVAKRDAMKARIREIVRIDVESAAVWSDPAQSARHSNSGQPRVSERPSIDAQARHAST